MLDFINTIFKGLVSFIIIIAMIAVLVVGIIFISQSFWIALLIWVIGFIIIVLFSGTISIFIEINEKLDYIGQLLSKKDNNPSSYYGNNSSIGNKSTKKCPRCQKEVDGSYSGCPHCGNTFSGNSSPVSLSNVTSVASKITKKCSKCKREVSDECNKCTHCGNDEFI